MNSDTKQSKDRPAPLAFEVREMARAKRNRGLTLDMELHNSGNAERSSDPYNTSGSFDRTKNWAKVGKR